MNLLLIALGLGTHALCKKGEQLPTEFLTIPTGVAEHGIAYGEWMLVKWREKVLVCPQIRIISKDGERHFCTPFLTGWEVTDRRNEVFIKIPQTSTSGEKYNVSARFLNGNEIKGAQDFEVRDHNIDDLPEGDQRVNSEVTGERAVVIKRPKFDENTTTPVVVKGETVLIEWVCVGESYKFSDLNILLMAQKETGEFETVTQIRQVFAKTNTSVEWVVDADLCSGRDYYLYIGADGNPHTIFNAGEQSNKKGTVSKRFFVRSVEDGKCLRMGEGRPSQKEEERKEICCKPTIVVKRKKAHGCCSSNCGSCGGKMKKEEGSGAASSLALAALGVLSVALM
ncbi:MAG: uncharacterized protein A8A55_0068 [Amphiamblys sp. WSBS2006]|nr:MAG: uncharacterized protein A8A55_0068 [Amphiamblys sp. WSBS2006]